MLPCSLIQLENNDVSVSVSQVHRQREVSGVCGLSALNQSEGLDQETQRRFVKRCAWNHLAGQEKALFPRRRVSGCPHPLLRAAPDGVVSGN